MFLVCIRNQPIRLSFWEAFGHFSEVLNLVNLSTCSISLHPYFCLNLGVFCWQQLLDTCIKMCLPFIYQFNEGSYSVGPNAENRSSSSNSLWVEILVCSSLLSSWPQTSSQMQIYSWGTDKFTELDVLLSFFWNVDKIYI